MAVDAGGAPRQSVVLGGASEILDAFVSERETAEGVDDRATLDGLASLAMKGASC